MVVCEPTLYILATNRKYDEIVARLEKNETSSLEWQDFQGNTVLHILCRQDRMSKQAIDAVIEKRPFMVGLRNQSSWTPLHLACHQRIGIAPELLPDIDAIRLDLIRACPSAVSTRRESGYARENPLEMACTARADIVVLEAMLCIDPSLAIPHKDFTNIMRLLQQLWNSDLKDHVALILLTAFFGHVVEDRRSFLLHAACFQRVPRDCFQEILRENQDQVLIPDHLGNLPLHHAVSQRQIQPEALTGFIVISLLELEPESARFRNHEGRVALHCALDQPRLTWHKGGLSKLVPLSCLSARDPRTGLYPLQMAALHANLSRLYLSTLYEILHAAPEVVQIGIPTEKVSYG
jgi:ankyrin repeat protein